MNVAQLVREAPIPATAPAEERLSIITVDDDPSVLGYLKGMLTMLKCDVAAYTDSTLAAKAIQLKRFDLVLLDANMPGLNGFELCRITRRSVLNPKAPILMLTGQDSGKACQEGFMAGVSLFLGKPITRPQLVGLLNVATGMRRNEKRKQRRVSLNARAVCYAAERRFDSTIVNIGEGGITLLDVPVNKQDEIRVQFALPDTPGRISVSARVLARDPGSLVSAEFIEVSAEDLELIRRYVSNQE